MGPTNIVENIEEISIRRQNNELYECSFLVNTPQGSVRILYQSLRLSGISMMDGGVSVNISLEKNVAVPPGGCLLFESVAAERATDSDHDFAADLQRMIGGNS